MFFFHTTLDILELFYFLKKTDPISFFHGMTLLAELLPKNKGLRDMWYIKRLECGFHAWSLAEMELHVFHVSSIKSVWMTKCSEPTFLPVVLQWSLLYWYNIPLVYEHISPFEYPVIVCGITSSIYPHQYGNQDYINYLMYAQKGVKFVHKFIITVTINQRSVLMYQH